MSTLLYENLPLRTTSIFGEFDKAEVVPVVYGDMSSSPVPLAKINPTDFVLDGKIEQVLGVYVSGVETTSYSVETKFTESDGLPYTLISMGRPIDDVAIVTATVRGKLSPKTGRLLENPADIIEDILSLAGIEASYPGFRAECARLDITLAGVLNTNETVQSHIDKVAGSCGAIWSISNVRLYPSPDTPVPVANLTEFEIEDFSLPTNIGAYAGACRIAFDYNYYKGQPARYMELEASPSPFGEEADDRFEYINMPWARSAKLVQDVGTRLMRRLASPKFRVTFKTPNRGITATDWVGIDHPDIPFDGVSNMMVITSSKDLDLPENYLEGEVVANDPVQVKMTSVSSEARLTKGGIVSYKYSIATKRVVFTVTDSSGVVVAGAKVSLDGGDVLFTTNAGTATVEKVEPGLHVLYVQRTGLISYRSEITL